MSQSTEIDKIITLFEYIYELCNIKGKLISNIKDQLWHLNVVDIPKNEEFIKLNFRDSSGDEEYDNILLEVRKPTALPCPEPKESFRNWLNSGWDNPKCDVSVKDLIISNDNKSDKNSSKAIAFTDDPLRVSDYKSWKIKRDEWSVKQNERIQISELFVRLHKLHFALRDSDDYELLVGSGLLIDKKNSDLSHPILLKRVKTELDAVNNIARIVDTDIDPELYTSLLTSIEDLNLDIITDSSQMLANERFHPLDRVNSPTFLKHILHSLSSDSIYIDSSNHKHSDRFQMRLSPVFFERARLNGAPKAIKAVIDNIKKTKEVPSHLMNLVSLGTVSIIEDDREITLTERLAAVGGEDTDILLSKVANTEQLEIARRISKYDAVLVQGPPGTGKTHTIANLLGHFLSQGKTVLVSSHTKKALSVVREKVDESLQDLCVPVLEDNNSDMEKSVNKIADMITRYSVKELNSKIIESDNARKNIIHKLAEVRQRIYEIKNHEFSSIVIGGKEIKPIDAAKFIREHLSCKDIIPGRVLLRRSIPLNYEELKTLYSSNSAISMETEAELKFDLPNPEKLLSPEQFSTLVNIEKDSIESINAICAKNLFSYNENGRSISLSRDRLKIEIKTPSLEANDSLKNFINNFDPLEEWMIYAAADGRAGTGYADPWLTLISMINETIEFSKNTRCESLVKNVVFSESVDFNSLLITLPQMIKQTEGNKKLSRIDYFLHSDYKKAESMVMIDGVKINNHNDYLIALNQVKLHGMRVKCARLWDKLLSEHGIPKFESLKKECPEDIAANFIPKINRYLKWYANEFSKLHNVLVSLGISETQLFTISELDTNADRTKKILTAIYNILPIILLIIDNYLKYKEACNKIEEAFSDITLSTREYSKLCTGIAEALKSRSIDLYKTAFYNLKIVYDKYELQRKRIELLQKLYSTAPDWSDAIRKREGIHGSDQVPQNIDDAWLWKQYDGILNELNQFSMDSLLSTSSKLSQLYREKTAELAKWKAWYALKLRIESNLSLKSSLISWEQDTKKMGKARRMTNIYRNAARNHMKKCQPAVPVWIMTISKAFENYSAGINKFDVVIVDEASQADLASLAITYMAKKVIIVGDDKQVTPVGVGIESDRLIQLAEGKIKGVIPSWELYTGTTSLYDVVHRVYQSLMLREHFRCVPDIIGYSNKLSYDGNIKPLRDISNCSIMPAVVNYRVNGHRDGQRKQNDLEAKTIVALLKSCIERKEYENKTFGIISLLGDEQPKLIEKYLFEQIPAIEIEKRRITCGTSAQFQGDERDVIFLSMVDSNDSDGPLSLKGFGGSEDMYYNFPNP